MVQPQTKLYLERRGAIATIVINRPDQRNAINYEMWLELKRLAAELNGQSETRVVIIRGTGEDAFSAGADIAEFGERRNDSAEARIYSEAFDGAMDAVWMLDKPTISMIRGFCFGGGLELACCTDLRIAAEGSRFGIPTARLGVLVGYREMRRLLQLVGRRRRETFLAARNLGGEEALRLGLITRLVPAAELETEVFNTAQEIFEMPRSFTAGISKLSARCCANHRWRA